MLQPLKPEPDFCQIILQYSKSQMIASLISWCLIYRLAHFMLMHTHSLIQIRVPSWPYMARTFLFNGAGNPHCAEHGSGEETDQRVKKYRLFCSRFQQTPFHLWCQVVAGITKKFWYYICQKNIDYIQHEGNAAIGKLTSETKCGRGTLDWILTSCSDN